MPSDDELGNGLASTSIERSISDISRYRHTTEMLVDDEAVRPDDDSMDENGLSDASNSVSSIHVCLLNQLKVVVVL